MEKYGPERILEGMLIEPEDCGGTGPEMRNALAAELMSLDWDAPAKVYERDAAENFVACVSAKTSSVPPELVAAAVADCVSKTRGPVAAARRVWTSPRVRRMAWAGGAIAGIAAALVVGIRIGERNLPQPAAQKLASAEPAKQRIAPATAAIIGPDGIANLPAPEVGTPVTVAPNPPVAITSHQVSAADYPAESIARQEQGTVTIEFLIQTDGSVGECQVTRSSGFPALDQAACTFVTARWRYKPASLLDGSPVPFRMPANIAFQLAGGASANSFQGPSGPTFKIPVTNKALADAVHGAMNDAKAGRYAEAIVNAKEADAMPGKPAGMAPFLHQMIVGWAIQSKDYNTALDEIEKMIAANEGNKTQNLKQGLTIASLMNNRAKQKEFADQLGGGVATGSSAPDAERAAIYSRAMRQDYLMKNYAAAIANGNALKGIQPLDETSYLILIQSYYNLMDYANVFSVVQDAIIANRLTDNSSKNIQDILEAIAAKQAASGMPNGRVVRLLNVVRNLQHAAGQNTPPGQRNTAYPPPPPTPPVATTTHAVTADDYPPISIRLQEQGKVGIEYTISADGSVTECAVTGSSGRPRLDDAACEMVKKKWFFKPATQNGRPVSVSVPAEIIFALK